MDSEPGRKLRGEGAAGGESKLFSSRKGIIIRKMGSENGRAKEDTVRGIQDRVVGMF